MSSSLFRKTGFMFASLSGLYLMIFSISMVLPHPDNPDTFVPLGTFLMLAAVCFLFLLSASIKSLNWIQPVLFLAITPLPMVRHSSSMFSLGAFLMAILLLIKLGYLEKHKLSKTIIIIAYFYLCEILAGLWSSASFQEILLPILFTTIALIFLQLAYADRLVVYLKEPKPTLSLLSLKVTRTESEYLRALLKGESIKEIAIDAGVKESTVRNTLARVYRKFGVSDKSSLLAKCENFTILD
jgi:DNA-binding CsgD family transcriptional regulator